MEDKILVSLGTDHSFECATDIIGREGEGSTTQLQISIPEKLIGCSVYLDFEKPNGEKLRTPKLKIENGRAVYDVVQYLLTDDGEIKAQAVLITGDGKIWKSSKKKYIIQNSINALEEIPEKEDFMTEAQRVMDELSREIAEIAEIVANDQYFVDAVTENLEPYVATELAKRNQAVPEFANSFEELEESGDQSKLYVLPDGNIYAYTKSSIHLENNEYNEGTAKFNQRINSSYVEQGQNGCMTTDYIKVDYNIGEVVTIKGLEKLVENYGACFTIDFYDENKDPIRKQVSSGNYFPGDTELELPKSFNIFEPNNSEIANTLVGTEFVRIRLSIADANTIIDETHCIGLVINFLSKNKSGESYYQWSNTGHAFVPADYENRILDLEKENIKQGKKITELENSIKESGTLDIPSFWEDAVNECISKIKDNQVGKNCVTFSFFSDNHQRNGYAGVLIAKIMKECGIPYCFYGGDTISSGFLTESDMIAQDKKFDDIMAYIPEGRFCRAVGNHDGYWNDNGEKGYYTREKIYELFLRGESVAQNKHFGEDGTYYYVDDIASKVRFIVLNTNADSTSSVASVDSTQLTWLKDVALSFNGNGWSVVIISHHPIANVYHTNLENAESVITAVKSKNVEVIGWYSGHIHRDRIYTHLYSKGSDKLEGTATATALGFTQVTISSDNTSIAYENDDGTESNTNYPIIEDAKSHAIDFVTINKSTGMVNITRLGIGDNRSYKYADKSNS